MKKSIAIALGFSALCLVAVAAQAADEPAGSGLYVGVSLGRGALSAKELGLPRVGRDEVGLAGKLYAGYRLTGTWGVEAGYSRLGRMKEVVVVGGNSVTQGSSGHSYYLAGTGRFPLGTSFALNAKAGVSSGTVSGTNVLPASSNVVGSARSFMYGVGAEYRLSRALAVTADFDHFGKVSARVHGSMVSAGVRYDF